MMPGPILVFAEHDSGRLTRAAWEALAAGQQMGREVGGKVYAVVLGSNHRPPSASLAPRNPALTPDRSLDSHDPSTPFAPRHPEPALTPDTSAAPCNPLTPNPFAPRNPEPALTP